MNPDNKGRNFPPILMEQVFDDSFNQLSDITAGYKRYRSLHWALDTGIADILHQYGEMNKETLLAKINCTTELAGNWIDILLQSGILEKNDQFLSVSPSLAPYLLSDSPLYQGDSLRSIQEGIWSKDPEILQGDNEKKPERSMTPAFLNIMYQHSMRGEIQEITKILSSFPEFICAKKLLDIGGGHGLYSISFCQQNQMLNAVILDQPHITPFTLKMTGHYRMKNRIEVIPGDMNLHIPGKEYDMVFLSHILYRQKDISGFIDRILSSLNQGGLFITNHKFKEDWYIPEHDALTRIENMSIQLNHKMISEHEFIKILHSKGLYQIQSWKIPATTGLSTLHVAMKQ